MASLNVPFLMFSRSSFVFESNNTCYTAKITYFSKCIFRVYLIQGCNQKISLYLVWKSIICSTKSLLNYPYIYFLKGEIHVLNLNRISVIRIDSLLILCISKLICRDQNKIFNFHLLTSSRLSTVRDTAKITSFSKCIFRVYLIQGMQPEDLLIFSLKEHHLLYKIIVKLSLHLFS